MTASDSPDRANYPTGATLSGKNDLTNWVISLWALVNAFNLMLGGPPRWAGESYFIARQVPGSPYSWAIVLLIGASIFTLGHSSMKSWNRRSDLVIVGSAICTVWCFALAACQVDAFWDNPFQISGSGPIAYVALGVLYASSAASSWVVISDKRRVKNEEAQ